MKKQNSLKSFERYALNKEEMKTQKGGVFCEIYIAYAGAQGVSIDPNVMGVAEQLDETLANEGWWAALQQGAAIFMGNYN